MVQPLQFHDTLTRPRESFWKVRLEDIYICHSCTIDVQLGMIEEVVEFRADLQLSGRPSMVAFEPCPTPLFRQRRKGRVLVGFHPPACERLSLPHHLVPSGAWTSLAGAYSLKNQFQRHHYLTAVSEGGCYPRNCLAVRAVE